MVYSVLTATVCPFRVDTMIGSENHQRVKGLTSSHTYRRPRAPFVMVFKLVAVDQAAACWALDCQRVAVHPLGEGGGRWALKHRRGLLTSCPVGLGALAGPTANGHLKPSRQPGQRVTASRVLSVPLPRGESG